LSAPHPNFGCVIAHGPKVVGEGFLYAQGTQSAEVQAVEAAGESAQNATAYLNLEPGDCHGDDSAVRALTQVSGTQLIAQFHCSFFCFVFLVFNYLIIFLGGFFDEHFFVDGRQGCQGWWSGCLTHYSICMGRPSVPFAREAPVWKWVGRIF
jgi:hypothetical protein